MKLFSWTYVVLLLLFVYAPFILLFVCSFTPATVFGEWTGFSFELYKNLFSDSSELVPAIKGTVEVLVAVVITSVLLGTSAAIGYHYCRRKWLKNTVYLTNFISLINPDIIIAVSLLMLFIALGVSRGIGTVMIAQTVLCTPFVFSCVLPQLMRMSPDIYEASTDLGASKARTIFCAILPQIRGSIISGAAISASISLNDFAVTLFSRGSSGFETLSTFIYADSKRGGLTPELRALYSIIIFLMIVIMITAILHSSKRKQK